MESSRIWECRLILVCQQFELELLLDSNGTWTHNFKLNLTQPLTKMPSDEPEIGKLQQLLAYGLQHETGLSPRMRRGKLT